MRKPTRLWYRRCGADFIHGTMGLSLEEKGAYSLCLDLIYDHQGPIPDDARWLSGICNVSVRKWSALRDRLISCGKLHLADGRLSNFRAEKEIEIDVERARNFAESGAKGGNKTAENKVDVNKNNDIKAALVRHSTGEDKIREDKIIKDISSNEDNKARDALSILSEILDVDRSKAILSQRRTKRAAVTPHAIGLLVANLKKCPDPNAAADEMILRGWTSVKADWLHADKPHQQAPPRQTMTPQAARNKADLEYFDKLLNRKPHDEFDGETIELRANG